MKTLTIGKIRGLQQCATPGGKFAILALDHRNNMRRLLHPENETVTRPEEIMAFKQDVLDSLGAVSSAYLLDPLYSAGQAIANGSLPGGRGLLVAVDASGYSGDPTARQSELLEEWSVEQVKRMGTSAVKLLVYYHPHSELHSTIEALVQQTAEACRAADLPFFLEILTYSPTAERGKLPGREKQDVILESAEKLTPLGVDVLKAEFPLDIQEFGDFNAWQSACRQLSQASQVPWILLSASVEYEIFLQQVTAACLGGASGVAAGRAVWKEAVNLNGQARMEFLTGTARERMARLTSLVDALGKPWQDCFEAPSPDENWYKTY
ncbi:tagatose 1,6-diphosphate aldolase [Pelolinea submarina]|uniref:Tagatose 1,6-diphosphate aldolase n=1 Tax=Pelolinea submarina TaxID=913107 RepID=A0A3E0AF84_9CHLR|nr:tagatose 1,6-diphosphate aldolase [Pelolinea submarina]REG10341.1 tagatose 1,6-diphosphate aldolase [Pelolinea submarina]